MEGNHPSLPPSPYKGSCGLHLWHHCVIVSSSRNHLWHHCVILSSSRKRRRRRRRRRRRSLYPKTWFLICLSSHCRSISDRNGDYKTGIMANECKVPDDIGMLWCSSVGVGGFTKWNNEDVGKPVIAIGVYITVSTIYFVATIGADLFRSYIRNRSWYPSRYFSINAFSTTLLGIALKIPTDLTMQMPRPVDQLSKLSGNVLLCTVIAISIPSLGTMDKSEVISNVVALAVLALTVVVDTGIQLGTCAIYKFFFEHIMVMAFLLLLVAFLISTAMTIQTIKEFLERKFQEKSHDLLSESSCMNVNTIKDHISTFWLLADTSSPQFVIGRTATSVASAILSVTAAGMTLGATLFSFINREKFCKDQQSEYRGTIWAVFVTQLVMIVLGTIGPTSRCIWWSRKRFMYVFENGISVEEYWVEGLKELKESPLRFHSKSRWRRITRFLWRLSLTALIELQARVVQLSKLILSVAVVPIGLVPRWMPDFIIWILLLALPAVVVGFRDYYYGNPPTYLISLSDYIGKFCVITLLLWCCLRIIKLWRARYFAPPDLRPPEMCDYVLHLDGEDDFVNAIKESREKDTEACKKKAKKARITKLEQLIMGYGRGFSRVIDFDWRLSAGERIEYCWALPVATLACVAVALPDINQRSLDDLLEGVFEGFKYVTQVDKKLDNRGLQDMIAAAELVMEGLDLDKKWFDVDLLRLRLRNDGEKIVEELTRIGCACRVDRTMERERTEHSNRLEIRKVRAADCLHRICSTISSKYGQVYNTNEQLFEWLRATIADILGACLTNLPQVIRMECSSTAIEVKDEHVRDAVLLFEELEALLRFCLHPTRTSMYPQERMYIHQWGSRDRN